jgi:hypothetical protein
LPRAHSSGPGEFRDREDFGLLFQVKVFAIMEMPELRGISALTGGSTFSPYSLKELRRSPKTRDDGRTVADRRHLVHADCSARSEHRLEVLSDVTQRGYFVSPRAREYEPAAIELPEVRPLKRSPRFFKSRK